MQRRLAAIVAADVAGYSRLIGQDEEGTLTAMRALRSEVIDPLLAQHGGRIANTAGDSLLIEFPNAVEAVRCAVAVQEETNARSAELPEDRRILFRISVNIGDVVVEGEDLLGDGVNVAARLEGLAPAGGIVLSGTAFDQVRDKLDVPIEEIGEVDVKNISRPVRAYQVRRKGDERVAKRANISSRIYAAVAIVLLIATVTVGWWAMRSDFAPTDPAEMTYALPEQPSIAVLPLRLWASKNVMNGSVMD